MSRSARSPAFSVSSGRPTSASTRRDELLDAHQRFAPRPLLLLLGRPRRARPTRLRRREPRRELRIDGDAGRQVFPLAPRHARTAGARPRIRRRRQRLRLRRPVPRAGHAAARLRAAPRLRLLRPARSAASCCSRARASASSCARRRSACSARSRSAAASRAACSRAACSSAAGSGSGGRRHGPRPRQRRRLRPPRDRPSRGRARERASPPTCSWRASRPVRDRRDRKAARPLQALWSLNSLFNATCRISPPVLERFRTPRRRTDSCSACRAIDPSTCTSVIRESARCAVGFAVAVFAIPASVFGSGKRGQRVDGRAGSPASPSPSNASSAMSRSIDDGLRPDTFVCVVFRDARERRRIHQLLDRGAPHARIGVVARNFGQQIAVRRSGSPGRRRAGLPGPDVSVGAACGIDRAVPYACSSAHPDARRWRQLMDSYVPVFAAQQPVVKVRLAFGRRCTRLAAPRCDTGLHYGLLGSCARRRTAYRLEC